MSSIARHCLTGRKSRRRPPGLVEFLLEAIKRAEERLARIPDGHPAAIHIRSRQQDYRQRLLDLLDMPKARGRCTTAALAPLSTTFPETRDDQPQ
jgi:hypothetical protein